MLTEDNSHCAKVVFCVDIFLPSYPAWKGSQMCAGVWVGQDQSLSEEMASFLGTLDNFPSEPLGYCADSLWNSGNVYSFGKILSFTFIKWLTPANACLSAAFGQIIINLS